MYIMSNDENTQEEENPGLSNSQESTTSFSSKTSIEKDGELTAKEPAKERRVVVVKPSEVEYKEKIIKQSIPQPENKIKKKEKKEKKENNQLLLPKLKKQDSHL